MNGLITLSNLGVYGGILDTENFRVMKNRYQSLPLVESWLRDLHTLAVGKDFAAKDVMPSGLRYSESEFWSSRGLKFALRAMTGDEDEAVDDLIEEAQRIANEKPEQAISWLALEVNAMIISSQLKAEGKALDFRDLLELYNREPALQPLKTHLMESHPQEQEPAAALIQKAAYLYVKVALKTHALAYLSRDRSPDPIPLVREVSSTG